MPPILDLVCARGRPVVVGLDGRSGAGKSTLAAVVATRAERAGFDADVIDGDDFYAGGSAAAWDRCTAVEKVARVVDWRRQRSVLSRVRSGEPAEWSPFDWDSGDWDADEVPLAARVRLVASDLVILEGAYSCRPELADLLDLRILLDVPRDVRRRRLLEREGEEYRSDWEARWSEAEDHYFGSVMPAASFDLVVGTD